MINPGNIQESAHRPVTYRSIHFLESTRLIPIRHLLVSSDVNIHTASVASIVKEVKMAHGRRVRFIINCFSLVEWRYLSTFISYSPTIFHVLLSILDTKNFGQRCTDPVVLHAASDLLQLTLAFIKLQRGVREILHYSWHRHRALGVSLLALSPKQEVRTLTSAKYC